MASLEDRKGLIWLPRRVRVTARTRSMARFAHGLHAHVCAIAIRRENIPRWIQAGHVDGENAGECWMNLERTGPHASVCAKLHVLHAACSVRGADFRDDTLGWPARETVQVWCAGDVIGTDLSAQVTGEQRTLACVGNPSKASSVCDAQGDDKAACIARWKGRTGKLSTAAL